MEVRRKALLKVPTKMLADEFGCGLLLITKIIKGVPPYCYQPGEPGVEQLCQDRRHTNSGPEHCFSIDEAMQIRKDYCTLTRPELCRKYNASTSTIDRITSGLGRYKFQPGEELNYRIDGRKRRLATIATIGQAVAARHDYYVKDMDVFSLARKYNITDKTVYDILHGVHQYPYQNGEGELIRKQMVEKQKARSDEGPSL